MCSTFFILPVTRLSIIVTEYPAARRASARCDPITPLPPVINIFFIIIVYRISCDRTLMSIMHQMNRMNNYVPLHPAQIDLNTTYHHFRKNQDRRTSPDTRGGQHYFSCFPQVSVPEPLPYVARAVQSPSLSSLYSMLSTSAFQLACITFSETPTVPQTPLPSVEVIRTLTDAAVPSRSSRTLTL